MPKKTYEVFGISNDVLPDSYVDRGALDERLTELLDRGKDIIALRGASKCGKSWLRRKILTNPVVVQCRLGKTVIDLYTGALSELGIEFLTESTSSKQFKGSLKASGDLGVKLLAKIGIEVSTGAEVGSDNKSAPVGKDINDLRYVAEIIKASGRRVVIEDFHYLSHSERKSFAFDLKAFWDWGVQLVIVGVWSVDNLLLSLNPDLSGRMEEISITWSDSELGKILDKGGNALNISFKPPLRTKLIDASFGNAGQLQKLVLQTLDELKITASSASHVSLDNGDAVDSAAMHYAEQLNPLYQTFASNIASGIRTRKNSTGIYAHAMAVILQASDAELITGLKVDSIFKAASSREPRISLSNLKSILAKIESLQIDDNGNGLVLSYNPDRGIGVVDRQLLLYRRFATVSWPWEEIISESKPSAYEADQT